MQLQKNSNQDAAKSAQARLQAKRRARNRARRKARMMRRLTVAGMVLSCVAIVALTSILLGKKEDVIRADASAEVPVVEDMVETQQYTIVLDSGHSTYNTGAQGIVKEEEITAQTTEYLRLLLENDDNFTVVLTHEYDVHASIAERRQVGIDNEADFFISIHCNINAEDSSATGFEIYVQLPENENHAASYEVASDIAEAFIENGHTPRTGTGLFYCRYVTDASGNDVQYTLTEYEESITDYGGETYGVIKSDEYPGILIEQGYVNSETDVENWMSEEGMQKAAQIYYAALCDYFGTEPVSE